MHDGNSLELAAFYEFYGCTFEVSATPLLDIQTPDGVKSVVNPRGFAPPKLFAGLQQVTTSWTSPGLTPARHLPDTAGHPTDTLCDTPAPTPSPDR